MIDDFKAAFDRSGLSTKEKIIPDGRMHRFHIEGDRPGSKNGWYVLYGDGLPSGAFGSWKTGFKGTWYAKPQNTLTPAERRDFSDTIKRRNSKEPWKNPIGGQKPETKRFRFGRQPCLPRTIIPIW
ncbi:MAG: hypothetical protein LRY36_01205 [Alphaproteobacteria bacterium]|nr:hypothetical protein [Alphaproteobacteria bacterium]